MSKPNPKSLFLSALELGPAERSEFLANECGEDHDLRKEVDELLRGHDQMGSFHDDAPKIVETAVLSADLNSTHIGPYKIREKIGEGGMGVVYVAEQTKPVQRKVAIKVIKPGMDTKEGMKLLTLVMPT